jgi:hypothetical protein
MRIARAIGLAPPGFWHKTAASLLPLWLFSVAVMAEGFPRPPISAEAAIAVLIVALLASAVLLWKGWVTIGLLIYSLSPFLLLVMFDEISTAYKTPFIIVCTLVLTGGALACRWERANPLGRLLILVAAAGLALLLASRARFRFWAMAAELGYEQCFPDAHGCPPLTDQATPWWGLFFGP